MVGLMQIMIYLFCVYLVYKGVEIFQIAFVSSPEGRSRPTGIVIGAVLTAAAIVVAVVAIGMEESIAAQIGKSMDNLPKLR